MVFGDDAPLVRGVEASCSVAAAAVWSRPDEVVTLSVLVFDEVGVDRSSEARIVELETQVVRSLTGLLVPGSADFDLMRCTA